MSIGTFKNIIRNYRIISKQNKSRAVAGKPREAV